MVGLTETGSRTRGVTGDGSGYRRGRGGKGISVVRGSNETTYKAYNLLGLLSGLVGGAVAGAVFTRLWRTVAGAASVPEPIDVDRRVRDVVVVGALQGAVFGVVRAVLSRLTAQGYRAVTGHDVKR